MNQIFARIETIDDLLPHIAGKEAIRVQKQSNGTTVVCYMIDDGNLFENPYELECRGIVFDKNGKIICRPLHKFFNLNENEQSKMEKLDFNNISRFMVKLDGSMLTPALVDGVIAWKTKKKFETHVSLAAVGFINQHPNINAFCQEIVEKYTPIFEFTTPQQRIVLHYPQANLTLLHIRDLITGEYQDLQSVYWKGLIEKHNIKTVDETHQTMDKNFVKQMLETLSSQKDLEGYVLQFKNGDMVKLKTQWYLNLHHVMTFLRERDIAELVIEEKIDDVKSMLVSQGASIDVIEAIQKKVSETLLKIEHEVEGLYEKNKNLSKKEAALEYKGYPYFGLLMNKFAGQEPKYKDYFIKHILKNEYSLESMNVIEDNLFHKGILIEPKKMKF